MKHADIISQLTNRQKADLLTGWDFWTTASIEAPEIPSAYQTHESWYSGTGYSKGHMCTSNDRQSSREQNNQTFYISNAMPQNSTHNSGLWNTLENKVNSWGNSKSFRDTLYVVKAGTIRDDQVLEYIATNIKSNIRELEGAIKKINAYSRLNNVEITLENAQEALKDMIYPEKNDIVTPDRIMSVVCDHYGVKSAAIISQKKDSEIVIPRQIIMYLCKNYTDITYDAIAKMLGKKDHSTIMHGANKIKNDLADNDELRGNVEVILKKLNIKA